VVEDGAVIDLWREATAPVTLSKEEQRMLTIRVSIFQQLKAKMGYTKQHIKRLERFLTMAACPRPLERFKLMQEELDWGPRTTSTHFGCLRSVMRILELPTNAVEWRWWSTEIAKTVALAPSWDYEDPSQVLNNATIAILERMTIAATGESHLIMVATMVTLALGQRMSDVLLLQHTNIQILQEFYAITFKEGKTVAKRGAYTLLITRNGPIGQLIRSLPTRQEGRVFPQAAESKLKAALHKEGLRVDIRALRRTGLIRLALAGATTEELLAVSRHASHQMLNLYLAAGMFNLHVLRPIAACADRAYQTGIPCIAKRSTATEATD
jgi:hypothetical protein